ncbi:hypothetical protein ACR0ST_08655 [Aliidiomarina sp. Khilg15.8]
MRKSDKKTDNEIIRALTAVCEQAKDNVMGFRWLTHDVDYERFPESLRVTLVFSGDVDESQVVVGLQALVPEVQEALQPVIGVILPTKQIEAGQEHTLH